MEAIQPNLPDPNAAPSRPREICWPVMLSVDADTEYRHLCASFDEFEPSFRAIVSQMAWTDVTPRNAARGIYELVLPEGRSMPTIRIQYSVTDRALVIQRFERSELLGSPTIGRKFNKKR